MKIEQNIYGSYSRSSHGRYSIKKAALKNFAIFTGKHLWLSLFFNKVAGLRPETLLKKRLQHNCSPVNITKFLRKPILKNICKRLFCYSQNFLEPTSETPSKNIYKLPKSEQLCFVECYVPMPDMWDA